MHEFLELLDITDCSVNIMTTISYKLNLRSLLWSCQCLNHAREEIKEEEEQEQQFSEEYATQVDKHYSVTIDNDSQCIDDISRKEITEIM